MKLVSEILIKKIIKKNDNIIPSSYRYWILDHMWNAILLLLSMWKLKFLLKKNNFIIPIHVITTKICKTNEHVEKLYNLRKMITL